MRQLIRDFVALCAETIETQEPIYEFGALNVPGQEGFADLREYFPNKHFVGADMREGPGVDVILDLHKIALPDNTAGTIISVETLEHVQNPQQAVAEMLRVLKQNGTLILTSVLNFPIHDYPADYWRFTPQAFRTMLETCEYAIVDSAGEELFPHTVIAIAFNYKPPQALIEKINQHIAAWKGNWNDARVTAPWSSSAMYVPIKELEEKVSMLESRCKDLEAERNLHKWNCDSEADTSTKWTERLKRALGKSAQRK